MLSSKPGWDIKKAFGTFLLANRLYWTPNSNFNHGACGVKRAAKDLGYNVDDVMETFQSVGIKPCSTALRGMDALGDISAKAGEGKKFIFSVERKTKSLEIETAAIPDVSEGDADLYVDATLYKQSSKSEGSFEYIKIVKPAAVSHTVTVKGESTFTKVSLKAIIDTVMLEENGDVCSDLFSFTYRYNFSFPPEVVSCGHPVAVRASQEDDPAIIMAASYETLPDLMNNKYQFLSLVPVKVNGTTPASDIVICTPQEGTYHLEIMSLGCAPLKIWYSILLRPSL